MSRLPTIVFDYGGVLSGPPFEVLNEYGDSLGLPQGTLEGFFIDDPVFSAVERGEKTTAEFFVSIGERCQDDHGVRVDIRRAAEILQDARALRPEMVRMVGDLAEHHRLAMLTNNVKENDDWLLSMFPAGTFAHIINSAAVGLRKPDPAIYEHLLEVLGTEGSDVVYVDDFAVNLPPAEALGIRTILFRSPEQVRAELIGFGAQLDAAAPLVS
jgi:epoxide hydrolase-like predicted phosphatase